MSSVKSGGEGASGTGGSTKRLKQSPPTPEKVRPKQQGSELTLSDLMAELLAIKSTVTRTSDTVAKLQQDYHTFQGRLDALEQRASDVEDLRPTVGRMEYRLNALESAVEDQENRSRRHNVRIHGLPEGAEGVDPIVFLEKMLPDFLKVQFEQPFEIEAAHRVPTRSSPRKDQSDTGRGPRPVVLRILRRNQAEHLLRAARLAANLVFQGSRLSILPDLAAATIRRKKRFLGMRPKLREMGVRFGIVHPAVLKITWEGKTRTYHDPEDAQKFLDSHGGRMEESEG